MFSSLKKSDDDEFLPVLSNPSMSPTATPPLPQQVSPVSSTLEPTKPQTLPPDVIGHILTFISSTTTFFALSILSKHVRSYLLGDGAESAENVAFSITDVNWYPNGRPVPPEEPEQEDEVFGLRIAVLVEPDDSKKEKFVAETDLLPMNVSTLPAIGSLRVKISPPVLRGGDLGRLVAKIPHLHQLDVTFAHFLQRTELSEALAGHLQQLTRLSLQQCQLGDDYFTVEMCNALRFLHIRSCGDSGRVTSKLLQNAPSLTTLEIECMPHGFNLDPDDFPSGLRKLVLSTVTLTGDPLPEGAFGTKYLPHLEVLLLQSAGLMSSHVFQGLAETVRRFQVKECRDVVNEVTVRDAIGRDPGSFEDYSFEPWRASFRELGGEYIPPRMQMRMDRDRRRRRLLQGLRFQV